MAKIKVPLLVLLLLLEFCLTGCQAAGLGFSVSEPEVLLTAQERVRLGLNWWPDGNLGVLEDEQGLVFFAANSGQLAKTRGSLAEPVQQLSYAAKEIQDLSSDFNYAAGGPVYQDEKTGLVLLFYHAEKSLSADKMFYSSIGLACSSDGGETFFDLGEIITAGLAYDKAQRIVEMGGAPFLVRDGYFYVYFRDYLADGKTVNNLALARAEVAVVLASAARSQTPEFYKYYQGSFTEPGLGGQSSFLEKGNPQTRWMGLLDLPGQDRSIMVVAQNKALGQGTELYLTSSQDGLVWQKRQLLVSEPGESFYPSLISGKDDLIYVYYTYSQIGEWGRWQDAALVRRTIHLH